MYGRKTEAKNDHYRLDGFQAETFHIKHDLISTGLFSDEVLSVLLDKHPKDQLDVCTLSDHPIYQYKFRTGDVRDVDGKPSLKPSKQVKFG